MILLPDQILVMHHIFYLNHLLRRCLLCWLMLLLWGSSQLASAQVVITNKGVPLTNGKSGVSSTQIYIKGDYKDSVLYQPGAAGNITNYGTLYISGNFINRTPSGVFSIASGRVVFNGIGTQRIVANGKIMFNQLFLDKAGTLVLDKDIQVIDTLRFMRGFLNLNGKTLELGDVKGMNEGGMLVGEKDTTRILGTTGQVLAKRVFSISKPLTLTSNLAGLGLQVSSPDNVGELLISRKHVRATGAGDKGSIARTFELRPDNEAVVTAMRLAYFPSELSGLTESKFSLWSYDSTGKVWTNRLGTVDMANHAVSLSNPSEPFPLAKMTIVSVGDRDCNQAPVVKVGSGVQRGDTLFICRNGDGSVPTVTLDPGPNTQNLLYNWSAKNSARPTSETSQTITVAENGLYFLRVKNTNGCATTDSIRVIIGDRPVAKIGFDNVCLGQTVQFRNTSTGIKLKYRWDFGVSGIANDTSSLATPTYKYSQTGTYTVSLTCLSATGCDSTITRTLTVSPIPVAAFAFSNVCVGNPVAFTNQSSVAGNGALAYRWEFGTGQAGDTSAVASPTFTFSKAGTYQVRLRVSSVAGGCLDDTTRTITIYPKGNPGFSVANTCFGENTTFNFVADASLSVADIVKYQWNFGDGTSIEKTTAVAVSRQYTVAQTYPVTLTYTTKYGCTNMVTKSVSIAPLPVLKLSNNGTITTCASQITLDAGNPGSTYRWSNGSTGRTLAVTANGSYSITVTSANNCSITESVLVKLNDVLKVDLGKEVLTCGTHTLNAGPGSTYLWSTGATTQQITVSTSGSYWVKVGAGGCEGRDTVGVTIHSLPVVNLGTDKAICEGDVVLLDAGNPGSSYQWSDGSTNQTLTATRTGTYWVTVMTANGCSFRDELTISTAPKPIVNLGPDQSLCVGQQVVLNAGNAGASYEWGSSTGLASAAPSIRVTSSGTYWVKVLLGNCQAVDSVNIQISTDSLNAVFLTKSLVDVGESIQFVQLSYPNPVRYAWDFGDGTTSTEESPLHAYLKDQDYNVQLIAFSASCSDTLVKKITVRPLKKPVEEVEPGPKFTEVLELKVYPNPTPDRFTLKVEVNKSVDVEAHLYSLNGVLLESRKGQTDQFSDEFDLRRFPTGMYVMKVIIDGKLSTMKVIKY